MNDNEHVYSVSQLCRETRLLLEGSFLTISIEGEISNLSRPASGHIYFTLKDDKAQIQCAMFRTQLRKVGFKPNNGLNVLLKARVSLYEARGNFQLIVEHMEAAGEGALRQKFEALKQKLSSEGLYDDALKKPLPTLPNKIAVITSANGAAIHDILSVLNNRFPSISVLVYPVTVQGDQAKHDIVDAIELANTRQDCDAIILARGGGSLEDLWAFNEEIVARAIHQSSLPIISAVGHEVDFTIADFVADVRAPTPSAAAEIISPELQQWLGHFTYLEKQLSNHLSAQLSAKKRLLEQLQHRLKRCHPGSQLQMRSQQLDDYQTRLLQVPNRIIQHDKLRLSQLSSRVLNNNPMLRVNTLQQRLILIQQSLAKPLQQKLQAARIRYTDCYKGLETLSPLATLSRGYSITKRQQDGAIINSVKQLKTGDKLHLLLTDGTINAQVDRVNENN